MRDSSTTTLTTMQTTTEITTTKTSEGATAPPSELLYMMFQLSLFVYLATSNNLGVILGLSLGLGIPAVLLIIFGFVFYLRKTKSSYYDMNYDDRHDIPMKSTRSDSENLIRAIY